MPNRHLSRIIAMQSLYEWDARPKADISQIIQRNIAAKENVDLDTPFIEKVTQGTIKNAEKIDKLIEKSAPEWPLEQIARVDKTILRLAIYELLFAQDVPPKVAIDEAVELGKAFGGENTSKFVNGVLGTVFRGSEIYKKEKDKTKKEKVKDDKKEKDKKEKDSS